MTNLHTDRVRDRWSAFASIAALIWSEATTFVKVRLGGVLLLVVATSAITALGPVALKWVVDDFANQGEAVRFSPILLICLYALSQWLARGMSEVRALVYARAERRILRTLSERLFAHVMKLPFRFHLERQTGALTQALDNGLQGCQGILHNTVFSVLPVIVELVTIVLVLSRFSRPVFLLLFCGALLCYAVAFLYAAMSISRPAKEASEAHIDATAVMTDSILNYETVKYFAAESVVQERAGKVLARTEAAWVRFFQRYAYNGLAVAAIFAAFLATAMLYAGYEVAGERMTVGDFVLINTYMLQIARPVEVLGFAMQGFSQGIAMLEKMVELLRQNVERGSATPSHAEQRDPALHGRQAPAGARLSAPCEVAFENVCLSYRTGRAVLRDVSFIIKPGKTLGIVGVSGSGKSTIVRLLAGLLEPDSGRILLDGIPAERIPLSVRRRTIGVVPQDTVLFNDTIRYNIAFGRAGSNQQEVERASKIAHLHDFVSGLPDQYETTVGERGVKLSGGEKQRISIARAVIKQPRMYVFDEATSSLDSRTEEEIVSNLREIAQLSTTLVIAHRLSTVVHADEILVLDQGRVVERGTHQALLRLAGRYADLWRAQVGQDGVRDPPWINAREA